MAAPQASAISETPTDHFTVVANNSNNTKMYQCNYCPSRITGTAMRGRGRSGAFWGAFWGALCTNVLPP